LEENKCHCSWMNIDECRFLHVECNEVILCWEEKFPPNNTLHMMLDRELFGM